MASSDYKDVRWQKMRLRILERDLWSCFACRQSTSMHVHHKRYRGFKPWNAYPEDLQTLCEACHEALGPHPYGGVWYERDSDMGPARIHREHVAQEKKEPVPVSGLFGKVYDQFDMHPENVLLSIERNRGKTDEETTRVICDVVVKKFEKAKRPPSKDGDQ